MQTQPGCASPSRRAATLTPSPKMSPSSTMMSPMLIPTRNSMRWTSAMSRLRAAMICWISTAQRTASTALANSTSAPSPVRLTTRPRCSAILGSIRSRRTGLVSAHQARVAHHVRRQDRGQAAFDLLRHRRLSDPRRKRAKAPAASCGMGSPVSSELVYGIGSCATRVISSRLRTSRVARPFVSSSVSPHCTATCGLVRQRSKVRLGTSASSGTSKATR